MQSHTGRGGELISTRENCFSGVTNLIIYEAESAVRVYRALRNKSCKSGFQMQSEWYTSWHRGSCGLQREWDANRGVLPLSDPPCWTRLRARIDRCGPLGCSSAMLLLDSTLLGWTVRPANHLWHPYYTWEMCLLCARRFIILRVEFHSPAMLFAFDFLLSRIYCFQDRCDLNRLRLLSSHSEKQPPGSREYL